MKYPIQFISLVEKYKDTHDDSLKFIGTGNPCAKILIIGQEVALDLSKEEGRFHYGLHQKNVRLWSEAIDRQLDFDQVQKWGRGSKDYREEDFSPLCPYYGDQKIHKNPKNGGTSKTWKCYQKLLSYIYPDHLSNVEIDFHKYAFITEMSSIPYVKSPSKNGKTAESIQTRTTHLFSEDFFQQFPVIIVASGNYVSPNMYDIDLQSIFHQKFVSLDSDPSQKPKGEWINIHRTNGRLLLHCRQLSFCSNNLLERLAALIKEEV